jgi:hypothetical protein
MARPAVPAGFLNPDAMSVPGLPMAVLTRVTVPSAPAT